MTPDSVVHLRQCVENAAFFCGRTSEDIRIVAASKTQSPEDIRRCFELGIYDFGENYVQELLSKQQILQDIAIHWHFIGHLQTNKVKYLAPFISCIHSVDSLKLAHEISVQAIKHQRHIDILLQVNTSGELSKSGVTPSDALELATHCRELEGIRLCGLMTLPAPRENPEDVRPEFRLLRQLRDSIRDEAGISSCIHLSMGMSDDFEIAIQEGATMIRLGSILFGERPPKNT